MTESYFYKHHEGFDQEPPDTDELASEAVHLANKQVEIKVVKDVFKEKPDVRCELRWLFHPVKASDDFIDKTIRIVKKKGNIFDHIQIKKHG